MVATQRHYYGSVAEITGAVEKIVKQTEIILDIGCGIVPINYFRPKLHVMVEPYEEYRDILLERHGSDKSVMVLKVGAVEALAQFGDASMDSIFLLDVIEHLEKDVGFKVISEVERVAREQVVIFTPLGFMPQHMEQGETDAWGLSGVEMQEHRSGWVPEDFGDGWEFHICENYHSVNFRGEKLDPAYGAFYAVYTPLQQRGRDITMQIPDIRRPLPSELKLEKAAEELRATQAQLAEYQTVLAQKDHQIRVVTEELDRLNSFVLVRAYRGLRRRLRG